MSRHFTFNDYANALKDAGLKTTENLLQRAIKDPDISFWDVIKLEDLADENENVRKQSPPAMPGRGIDKPETND